ncbi:MAG: L-2-amino-thiazoline-4-carboxylic acid hydrolase [Proteobacteria bacterium]|nr:L-2-amino-thiazoline-4-carboxylic acid hydrolase [Pseudomonadota bacterium]
MMKDDAFSITDKSESGTEWETFSFEQWALRLPLESQPYRIKPLNYLHSLNREIIKNLGVKRGRLIFITAILWDFFFKKPQWMPDKFNLTSKKQENFYKKKFNENIPVIVFFQSLARIMRNEESDKIIANTLVPVILDMMKSKFHPVENINSVEIWLRQARNYLGTEIDKEKGFNGTVFLAEDKSELRLHVTRCVNVEILQRYGLIFTAAAICMCDHITYHTVFPNLIFKRTHTLAIGDNFCDHELRLKRSLDTNIDADCYSDCSKVKGMREFVRGWEETAKVIFFGSREEWEKYANRCYNEANGLL